MARKISGLLVTFLAVGLLPSVAHASISVNPWPSGNSVVFGKKKFLEVKIRGYTPGELEGGRLIIRQAEFPYKNFEIIASEQASSALRYIQIEPRVNSRYLASFAGIDAGGETASTTVYVNARTNAPRVKWKWVGGRVKSVRYWSSSRVVFSSTLARRWRMVPRRRKPVYFYEHCNPIFYHPWAKRYPGRSQVYHLVGRSVPKTTVKGEKLIVRWPSFTYSPRCFVGGWEGAGIGKLPGYLPNGDDGAGAPDSTPRQYRKISRLLGRSTISRKKAQNVFGWP